MNTDNDADFYFDFTTAFQKMLLNGYRGDFGGQLRDRALYDSTEDNEAEWRQLCADMWAPHRFFRNAGDGTFEYTHDTHFKEQLEWCRFYPEYAEEGTGHFPDDH